MHAAFPPDPVIAGSSVDKHAAAPASAPVLDSRHLLRGQREVLICHGDDRYRLRHTRNGKLILTK